VNIASYAYEQGTGDATIILDTLDDNEAVSISFIDKGKPFDPLAKPDPDVTLSASERQIGGLGIYMVKKSMDKVTYEYSDGCNKLTIVRRIH
jgi:anti-sigma regulatory factor (Ser/Thr protein kinase)